MTTREQYRIGMSAYNAGRHEKAIELLTPLVADHRGAQGLLSRFYLGQAHYRLAVRQFRDHRYADATEHFQKAAAMNSVGGGFARYLAACHIATGKFDLAARDLELMLQQQPDKVDLRVRLALAQYKQGSPIEAMGTLRRGICKQPEAAELHYQLGVMLAAEEDHIEAERCFDMALAADPGHAGAYERLAQLCAVRARHERAMQYLQKAHELDPWNARVAFQLSLVGRPSADAAETPQVQWQAPAALPPVDEESLARLSEAILEEPEFVQAFLSLPETEVDTEVFSTLAATLERALDNHTEYADLHYHCGAVYRRLGRRCDAIEHTERAVAINPQYVTALIQLAELYSQTDQWAMGLERLEQAVQAGADFPDVHCLMGKLWQTGGQPDRARKAFERALELNHRYEAARQALASLPA